MAVRLVASGWSREHVANLVGVVSAGLVVVTFGTMIADLWLSAEILQNFM